MKTERFFIVCRDLSGRQRIYFDEVEGMEVFRVKGFRFFLYGDRLCDVLSGCLLTWWRCGYEDYDAFIERAKKKIESHFDQYLDEVKKVLKMRGKFSQMKCEGDGHN